MNEEQIRRVSSLLCFDSSLLNSDTSFDIASSERLEREDRAKNSTNASLTDVATTLSFAWTYIATFSTD